MCGRELGTRYLVGRNGEETKTLALLLLDYALAT